MRYGFLYGPGTWYHRNGASAQEIAEGRSPLVGDGGGLWPWLHVDDAASATVAALERGEGEMNVCDDESAPVAEWLPYAARTLRWTYSTRHERSRGPEGRGPGARPLPHDDAGGEQRPG